MPELSHRASNYEYSIEDFNRFVSANSNWGRWGDDDQLGALNLITDEKRVAAANLVQAGQVVSLSRPIDTEPSAANPRPAQRFVWREERGSADYLALVAHGFTMTHVDALCHHWVDSGMYNDFNPDDVFRGASGATALDIEKWSGGIVTRGVLLDVPAYRGTTYVDHANPVHGDELAAIAQAQGVEVQPGDAVVVYSGRDAYDVNHEEPWASSLFPRPGLSPSCLEFFKAVDASVLVWDMLEQGPYDTNFTVHAAIPILGMALIDNALLGELAVACSVVQRYDFQLIVAPLRIPGATGSPVNPLAIL